MKTCREAECDRKPVPHSPYCNACYRDLLSRATRAAGVREAGL